MLTGARELFAGVPVWEEYRRPRIATLSLKAAVSTDVVIIGGGISGAMIAEGLAGHGLDVIVVDRRAPITGSTSASTALVQYEIDIPLTRLSKMIGTARATAAWRRSRIAVESIAAKITSNAIECDFERKNSLYLAGDILDEKGLEEEALAREAIGLPTTLVSRSDLEQDYGIKCKAALLNRNNLTCNPVQLTTGFLNSAIDRGVRFFTPVSVESLTHRRRDVVLNTDAGFEITTHYVVFASGYEIPESVHTTKHSIASTWTLATAPMKGFDIPLFWQSSDPYVYGRATKDGRMIFGGADQEFADEAKRDGLMEEKQKTLQKKLTGLFPDLAFETTHFWGASFGGSNTGLPSIGKIPGQRNCYCAMAYGGNGITFSRIAADLIAASLLGRPDPGASLFAFGR